MKSDKIRFQSTPPVWTFLLSCFASIGFAQGIPEPDLLMYGTLLNITSNANLRLGYGTLTCVFRPVAGGSPITAFASLTNINNRFSYILRIPCETPASGFTPSTNAIQLTSAGITFDRSQVTWNSNFVSYVQPSQTNTLFFSNDRGRIERVDLTVSSPILIDPLNSLPVDWELTYFGRTGIDPFADPDGDGMNNFAEYRAGTDPNDPASELRFTEIRPVQNGILEDRNQNVVRPGSRELAWKAALTKQILTIRCASHGKREKNKL
jgi:hypothetical protein